MKFLISLTKMLLAELGHACLMEVVMTEDRKLTIVRIPTTIAERMTALPM